jgi:hypothetical protein
MAETAIEERIAGLEDAYKELTKRIDDLRSETHRGFDLLRAEISDLKTELRSSFRWTMSLVLINWLSLLAAIFLVAAKR